MTTSGFAFQSNHLRQGVTSPTPSRAPFQFHQQLPGYVATPLISAPMLAQHLGIGTLLIKDESSRFSLPAFKVLGASWAACRKVSQYLGLTLTHDTTLDVLRTALPPATSLTLVAATDGNHGRAVAHIAHLLGIHAHILVPHDMAQARIAAIQGEGATVQIVAGSYDDAVALAAGLANEDHLVIADTAWPGYEEVPQWVIEGYATILWEIADALGETDASWPDLTFVQIGVGALATAVTRHLRQPTMPPDLRLIGVEPTLAACLYHSVAAGEPIEIPGPHHSSMAGLNCGIPSSLAWPVLSAGVDAFVTIDDPWAEEAMRYLAAVGVVAGETGAASLGGLLASLADPAAREVLDIGPTTSVLVINTEGATDPVNYQRIVAHH
jgi:diaminopropionate ammonia-lyase